MISSQIILNLFNFSIDWNETLTLSLILFSVGLLCIISAILLAIYLLKSDRFTTPSLKEPLTSLKKREEASHLSRLKNRLKSLVRRKKSVLKPSINYDLDIKLKDVTEIIPESPEDEPNSSN
jgi:hypothetical protein